MSEINPFDQTSNPEYSQYIALSRYSRWLESEGRRESWKETVDRLIRFWEERHPEYSKILREEIEPAIYNLEIMPSMRSLMTAGPALDRDEVAGYNCSFTVVDHPRCFDEIMYVLLCGTGVGFSVERQHVQKLPEVPEEFYESDTPIIFSDSKIGWASGYRELIALLYAGKIPKLDFSKIRPAGSRLKTFGGRASGPDPLKSLCMFTIELFKSAKGRRLNSIECHDLVCKIADIVVVGGVRRAALISLSNLSDDRMRTAKMGNWWHNHEYRGLSNNSYVLTERPSFTVFLEEWTSLYESMSGERGIFSRVAAQKQSEKNGRRDHTLVEGTNPCSEILLRDKQMCNLSEVIIRKNDTKEDLLRKIRLATIVGTLQSTLTNFRYLRKKWSQNCEEERLLGVSLTGIMDNKLTNGSGKRDDLKELLNSLRAEAVKTNKEHADKLGINQSTAITCVKPSGTVSQLTDTASGIHPRFSEYYIRSVRADNKDPLAHFMIDKGFYHEVDKRNPHVYVFYFPMKAPKGSVTADDMGALNQLDLWEIYQDEYCEHKPSMTCYYTDDEFLAVGDWVWRKLNKLSGVSFLPVADHSYEQPPYQAVNKDEYNSWLERMPKNVDWSEFISYEAEDFTTGSQELACVGATGCEL